MSDTVSEDLIKTNSIAEGLVSIESAIAEMGKAATLAEWVYAGLRIETRDWSAELRKTADTSFPKITMLENSIENTGSVDATDAIQKAAPSKTVGSSVGVSGAAANSLDQMLSGVREAKVMGEDRIYARLTPDSAQVSKILIESSSSSSPSVAKIDAPLPGVLQVGAPAVEAVLEIVEVVKVVAPAETQAVIAVTAEPPVVDTVVEVVAVPEPPVLEAEVEIVAVPEVVAAVATPVLFEVTAEPPVVDKMVEVVAVPEITDQKLDCGRLYFHDFDAQNTKIIIQSDYFTDFDTLIAGANMYQDGASTVLEMHNGLDFIVLTQFTIENFSADLFVFEPVPDGADNQPVYLRENPVELSELNVAETSDVFSFGLNSGRIYVTDFDTSHDRIFITADLFANFDEMMSRVALYQDATSAVIELHDGADMIIMPHFSIDHISADMFVFEAASHKQESLAPSTELGTIEDDVLVFGTGNQIIDPGLGFDVVTGGAGDDIFVFGATSGHDFIVDFSAGQDLFQINSDLATDFDSMMKTTAIYQDGGSTQIEFAGGQLITLFATNAQQVASDWFSFS